MREIWVITSIILPLFFRIMAGSDSSSQTPVRGSSDDDQSSMIETAAVSSEEDDNLFTMDQGRFALTNGWKLYEPKSLVRKPVFVPGNYNGSGVPDNITVEHGTSNYPAEDSVTFGRAIMVQLQMQAGRSIAESITASGITSDKGEAVLIFKIPMADSLTTQYYICGDHEYILVHETNFSGSSESTEVAENIVNTFEWTKGD